MKKTCDYCGNYLSETDENCPHCGAPNPNLKRAGEGVPATIEELRAFCEKHDMPLEQMRFFIGEDCREARAFGVYQDEEGMFVVYKNKGDGSRAVRYRGRDEAYAVNELYQKLQSELLNQKRHQAARDQQRSAPQQQNRSAGRKKQKELRLKPWLIVGAILLLLIIGALLDDSPAGYYDYGGEHYYAQSGDWYFFDNALNSWIATEVDDQLSQHYQNYYAGTYESGSDYPDWNDSEYASDYDSGWSSSYDDDDGWESDWDDDDWDYDYDDWDSGYSDWDSDW